MSEPSRHSVSVAAVITDESDRVLVVQRRDTGAWEIPGGVLEPDESIPAGLRREVQEETGVLVEPGPLTGVYKNLRLGVVALVFRAELRAGLPSPTEGSAAVAWWSADEVRERMAEVFAIRIQDALAASAQPAIRMHDGIRL
jgi:8-oxo-dGTP pyrophosphatase MutT (NUDIX family)